MKRTEYFALITAAITLWTTVAHGMVVCARDDGTGKPREGSKLVLKYQCRIGKEVEVGIAYDPGTGSVRLSRAVVSGGLTVTDGDESVSVLAGMCGSFDTTGCYEGPRFDGSGSTILDPVTGLEWEKKNASDSVPDLTNPHDADNGYTWCERAGDACANPGYPFDGTVATDFLARLNGSIGGVCYEDHCDWRLPTIDELRSISQECFDSPCVIDDAFLPANGEFTLSSSAYSSEPALVWSVLFNTGSPVPAPKPQAYPVRAVRSLD